MKITSQEIDRVETAPAAKTMNERIRAMVKRDRPKPVIFLTKPKQETN